MISRPRGEIMQPQERVPDAGWRVSVAQVQSLQQGPAHLGGQGMCFLTVVPMQVMYKGAIRQKNWHQ